MYLCIIQKIDYSKRKGGYLYFEDGLFSNENEMVVKPTFLYYAQNFPK